MAEVYTHKAGGRSTNWILVVVLALIAAAIVIAILR